MRKAIVSLFEARRHQVREKVIHVSRVDNTVLSFLSGGHRSPETKYFLCLVYIRVAW